MIVLNINAMHALLDKLPIVILVHIIILTMCSLLFLFMFLYAVQTIHPRMRVMELPVEGASASIVVTFQDFHNGSSYRNLRSPRDKATWLHNALNSGTLALSTS